jgi:glucose-6-phosphate 1-epimerase
MSTEDQIQSLQARFGIGGALRFEVGAGGLIRVVCTGRDSEGQVYLHGAHVAHYQRRGEKPLIFMSGKSLFAADKAIRGGVPICFPWFGPKKDDAKAPAHGFARLKQWRVESTKKTDDGGVQIVLLLGSDDSTRALWPCDFLARYTVTFAKQLRLRLEVRNTGGGPIVFEEALHTYLSVGDIRQVRVEGLSGIEYIDKVQGGRRLLQGAEPLAFVGETDRVYLNTQSTCVAHDPVGGRSISVSKSGSDTTVVWNPWIAKAKAMADFGDDEWPTMVCIETCNVADFAVTLAAGASHTMEAVIA